MYDDGVVDAMRSPGDGNSPSEGMRSGPTWRAWAVTVLVAIVLSVTATLLLGGTFSPKPELVPARSAAGCGGGCCDTQGGVIP